MKTMSVLGVVAGILLVAWLLLPGVIWDGNANVRFRFHLVDSGDGHAIKDAKIRAIRDSQLVFVSDTTLNLYSQRRSHIFVVRHLV